MRTILKLIFLLSLLLFVVAPPAEASVRSLSSVRCPWVVAPVTFTYDGCELVYDASKQPKYDYDQSSILIASEKGNQPTGNFAFFAAFPKLVAPKKLPISTGRTTPNSLTEKLALEEVMSKPSGYTPKGMPKMSDTKNGLLDKDGWVKRVQNVNGVEVHYVENINTGQFLDFKFK